MVQGNGDLQEAIGKLASMLGEQGGTHPSDSRLPGDHQSNPSSYSASHSGGRGYSDSDGYSDGDSDGSTSSFDSRNSRSTGSSRSSRSSRRSSGSSSNSSHSSAGPGTRASRTSSRPRGVPMPAQPRPVDLWRAAHEITVEEKQARHSSMVPEMMRDVLTCVPAAAC